MYSLYQTIIAWTIFTLTLDDIGTRSVGRIIALGSRTVRTITLVDFQVCVAQFHGDVKFLLFAVSNCMNTGE